MIQHQLVDHISREERCRTVMRFAEVKYASYALERLHGKKVSLSLILNPKKNLFTRLDPDYRTGICYGCYLLLNKKWNGHNVTIPITRTYKSDNRSKFLRSSGSTCQCPICTIAHYNVNQFYQL